MTRVFIASSGDLIEERKELEILLYRENFTPIVWENIDHSISKEKFQERTNKEHLAISDTVIFMIKSKLGKYTLEEFTESFKLLGDEIEKIYIYFFEIDRNKVDDDELFKILSLQNFLKKEEKFYKNVKSFNELKSHFLEQKKHISPIKTNQSYQYINDARELLMLISNAPDLYTSAEILKKINNQITRDEIIKNFEPFNNFLKPRKQSLLLAYILSNSSKETFEKMKTSYLSKLGNPEIPKLMKFFNASYNLIQIVEKYIYKRFMESFTDVHCNYIWLGTN
jgi:hypothetical protein